MKRTAAFLFSLLMISSVHATVTVERLTAHPVGGVSFKGDIAYLSAYHTTQVKNDSDTIKTIFATYTLCAEFKGCETHRYKIRLNPHSSWHDHYTTFMNPVYTIPGRYKVTATTSIEGDATGSFEGYAMLSVS